MTTPRPTITGPRHPLDQAIDRARGEVNRLRPTAVELQDDSRRHDDLDGSVFRLVGETTWEHVGSMTDSRHLLGVSPDLVEVHPAREHTDGLAVEIARRFGGGNLVHPQRAVEWRDAAVLASPMVDVLLAVCVRSDLVEWDTGESVSAASRRLCKDAALRITAGSGRTRPMLVKPGAVFDEVVATMGLATRPVADYAQVWLDDRDGIIADLAARGIGWGGARLTARQAADRARVVDSTWRAYVSRGTAPAPETDDARGWTIATVDAWRLTRTTITQAGWW